MSVYLSKSWKKWEHQLCAYLGLSFPIDSGRTRQNSSSGCGLICLVQPGSPAGPLLFFGLRKGKSCGHSFRREVKKKSSEERSEAALLKISHQSSGLETRAFLPVDSPVIECCSKKVTKRDTCCVTQLNTLFLVSLKWSGKWKEVSGDILRGFF